MSKTPKIRKKEISKHSRAARRGPSPPPKNLAVKAAVEETEYKPWLHSVQSAGVSKKKRTKNLTRQQRLRQQRGQEKADANLDKLERKVADSRNRGRQIDARRVDWAELNGALEGIKRDPPRKESQQEDNEEAQGENTALPEWEQSLSLRSAEMSDEEDTTAGNKALDEAPPSGRVDDSIAEIDEVL